MQRYVDMHPPSRSVSPADVHGQVNRTMEEGRRIYTSQLFVFGVWSSELMTIQPTPSVTVIGQKWGLPVSRSGDAHKLPVLTDKPLPPLPSPEGNNLLVGPILSLRRTTAKRPSRRDNAEKVPPGTASRPVKSNPVRSMGLTDPTSQFMPK